MIKSLYTLAAVSLFTLPIAANASIIYSTTGLSGTFTTENFDINGGEGTAAASQFTGVVFGAGNYVSNFYNGSFPNMVNYQVGNFVESGIQPITDPTSFNFTSDIFELAFAFVSNPQTTTVSAFLNNILVESVALSTDYSGNYVSISGYTFDEVRITSIGSNNAYILDDMQYKVAQVPEPAALALVGMGLAGLGFSSRKARAKA